MKIDGKIATKNEELKIWKTELIEAKKAHNISLIEYATQKVEQLEKEAMIERILIKLNA